MHGGLLFFAPKAQFTGCSVPGDEVLVLGLGWGRGSGLDLAEGDEAGLLLFLEDLLAVELGHAGVFGVLLDLRVARADLFFAGVLGDAGLVEGVVGGGVDVLLVEDQVVASPRFSMPTFLPPAKIS